MEHATFVLVNDEGKTSAARHPTPYESDIHAWAIEQAEFIRLGRFDELDIDNLADEVEDLAKRERRSLESRLSLVFQHLLKWDAQPARRSASWARTITEQRRQVDRLINDAPSLRPQLSALLSEAFQQGRVAALNETELAEDAVPQANPYSLDELMRRPIVWPES